MTIRRVFLLAIFPPGASLNPGVSGTFAGEAVPLSVGACLYVVTPWVDCCFDFAALNDKLTPFDAVDEVSAL